jgi:hypothetical protein
MSITKRTVILSTNGIHIEAKISADHLHGLKQPSNLPNSLMLTTQPCLPIPDVAQRISDRRLAVCSQYLSLVDSKSKEQLPNQARLLLAATCSFRLLRQGASLLCCHTSLSSRKARSASMSISDVCVVSKLLDLAPRPAARSLGRLFVSQIDTRG